MGSFEVVVTESAFSDLREALTYMRTVLGSPKAARDFLDSFEAQVVALETFPEGRPLVHDYELSRMGYRWCPIGNFMLFFRVSKEARRVTVDRLLYGARDWRSLL